MKKLFSSKAIFLLILIFLAALAGLPTAHGYLHPADPLILLAAVFLPTPSALLAAGAGSLLADLFKGYYLLAPFTLIIKLAMVLLAKKLLSLPPSQKHPELMVSSCAAVPVAGYFLAELILSLLQGDGAKAFAEAFDTLTKNLIQAAGSVLLFILLHDLIKSFIAAKKNLKEELKKQQEEENKDE